MESDLRDEYFRAVARLKEARSKYQALVTFGDLTVDLYLNPDHYVTPDYYELGPDERDIAGPGLEVLRAMGGSFEARVNGVLERSCAVPGTNTQVEFLTLRLTDD